MPRGDRAERDPLVSLGMVVAAVAAATSSFAGLRSLALDTGWPGLMAPLLPLSLDAYALTASRVWLSRTTRSSIARRFARRNAISAGLLSVAGNAAYHLIAAQHLSVSWYLIVLVGAIPPLVLVAVSHLAALRTHADPSESESVPGQPSVVPDGPRYENETALLEAARQADAAYRALHDGRAITRDELRKALRVSGTRASAVLRMLREPQPPASD